MEDPDTGNPIPILVKGNSAQSNIILALSGTGPIFGPNGSAEQMPPSGPKFTADQITSIANWIARFSAFQIARCVGSLRQLKRYGSAK